MATTINTEIIAEKEYQNNTTITDVVLGDNVRVIGSRAFWGCTNLKSITISANVEIIGDYAFRNCGNLTITHKFDDNDNKLEHLGYGVFMGCTLSGNFRGGSRLSHVGDCAFYGTGTNCNILIVSPKSIGRYAFYGCGDVTITSPYLLTDVQEYAFYGTSITSFACENEITIGDYAFYGCTGLTSVSVSNCTTIGKYAFAHCSALSDVYLGTRLRKLGEGAFQWCSSLEEAHIPKGILNLEKYTFEYCSNNLRLFFGTHVDIPYMGLRSISFDHSNIKIYVPDRLRTRWNNQWREDWSTAAGQDFVNDFSAEIVKLSEAPLINFAIGDIQFVAEVDMTWDEWIGSKYANYSLPANISVNEFGSAYFTTWGADNANFVVFPLPDQRKFINEIKIDSSNNNAYLSKVSPNAVIVSNKTYVVSE